MTDILTLPAMRAAFCLSCALPTGELYEEGSAPTVSFCNDCENLPNPWSCDRDGNTEIGTARRNRQRDYDNPMTDAYEAQRRREAQGITYTPRARPLTPRAQPPDPVQRIVEVDGPYRDANGRFAPRPEITEINGLRTIVGNTAGAEFWNQAINTVWTADRLTIPATPEPIQVVWVPTHDRYQGPDGTIYTAEYIGDRADLFTVVPQHDPPPEPETPAVPTCQCGSTRFVGRLTEVRRVRVYGMSPVYECAENEPGDMVVGVDPCINDLDDEEYIDGGAEVESVECYECGSTWTGEWETI